MKLREKIEILEKEVAGLELKLEKANADFHQMSYLRKLARLRIEDTSEKIDNLLAEIDHIYMLDKMEENE